MRSGQKREAQAKRLEPLLGQIRDRAKSVLTLACLSFKNKDDLGRVRRAHHFAGRCARRTLRSHVLCQFLEGQQTFRVLSPRVHLTRCGFLVKNRATTRDRPYQALFFRRGWRPKPESDPRRCWFKVKKPCACPPLTALTTHFKILPDVVRCTLSPNPSFD
jgi:hypothetical protein